MPSRTSQAVACMRADIVRPTTPTGDANAQRALCHGMAPPRSRRLWHHIVARTHFFDQVVLDAVRAGVTQVVICGAGYDDRALRFRAPGVRYFELDQGATQVDKARRLRTLGAGVGEPVLAAADFRSDDVAAVLARCGHDPAVPTLFLCEGLLVYLDEPTCIHLLRGLRACAVNGSQLAASLAVHPDGADTARLVTQANARRGGGRSEPWRTILPLQAHLSLITAGGWQVTLVRDATELDAEAPPDRTRLVTAVPTVIGLTDRSDGGSAGSHHPTAGD